MPNIPLVASIAATLLVAAVLGLTLFKMFWKVPAPNEALLISGRNKQREGGLGFEVVTGHGVLVNPLFSVVKRLSLDLYEADLQVPCVTTQGIAVDIIGVVIFKVGDTPALITSAARRFLDQQNKMVALVINVFEGHVRAIVGSLTVEDIIRNRQALTDAVREASGAEMVKLGLVVDSLQIKDLGDTTKYIENLAKPQLAEVARAARIAAADNDRQAAEAEAAAAAQVAEARRASEIKQARFRAEVEQAQAEAAKAGPLAKAAADKEIAEAQAEAAIAAADRRERELITEVRKPADAAAYKLRTEAEAAAAATEAAARAEASKLQQIGSAQAAADQAKGLAQARVTAAQGAALRANQEAVLLQRLVEQFPEVVRAAAEPFGQVGNLTVLNGAEGVNAMITGIVGNAMAMFPGLRDKLDTFMGTSESNTPEDEAMAAQAAEDLKVPATDDAPSITAASLDGRVDG